MKLVLPTENRPLFVQVMDYPKPTQMGNKFHQKQRLPPADEMVKKAISKSLLA